jgi:nicotinate-nucleotide pyrophosphorylase (carboxylating)
MKGESKIADDPFARAAVRRALEEDVGSGDATTLALVPPGRVVDAAVLCRGECTVSGCDVAASVFLEVDPRCEIRILVPDGRRAQPGETLMALRGPAQAILTAERTALNFMQRMTGIATLTARFVDKVRVWHTAILDTRKTTPGLRALEKYAVRCGGGENHRFGLFDRVLIKDNHRRLCVGENGDSGLDAAIEKARSSFPKLLIEVEVENDDELISALKGRPDWILLDNMAPADMARCVSLCAGRVKIEASGGVTLENVEEVARSGVTAISLGCLTHSAPAADLSLEIT